MASKSRLAVHFCTLTRVGTLDRLRNQGALTIDEAAGRTAVVNVWLEAVDLVLLRPAALTRASEPMPLPVGTVDAIDFVTALVWRDASDRCPGW